MKLEDLKVGHFYTSGANASYAYLLEEVDLGRREFVCRPSKKKIYGSNGNSSWVNYASGQVQRADELSCKYLDEISESEFATEGVYPIQIEFSDELVVTVLSSHWGVEADIDANLDRIMKLLEENDEYMARLEQVASMYEFAEDQRAAVICELEDILLEIGEISSEKKKF